MKCWIYHETEAPKVINSADYEEHKEDGWRDTPAAFLKIEAVGLSQEKIDAGDEEENAKAQQVFDAVEGVKESINGALNLDDMNKDEIASYALEHHGLELSKRKSLKNLRKIVREHINGNSTALH